MGVTAFATSQGSDMSKRIAIIGAGTGGLHLGLYLQQQGVDTTIFTDKRAEEYKDSRLPNTVAHFAVTLANENQLGVNHWQAGEVGYFGHNYYIGGPEPLEFYGDLHAPSRAVDYRIYLPTLMNDYVERGGDLQIRRIEPDDFKELAKDYDLIVVSTGKGTGGMFKKNEELSPYTEPQRRLCVGIFKGIKQRPTRAVTMYFSPGAGEMIEIPTLTFNGLQNALVFDNIKGGDLEILVDTKYDDDPAAFKQLMLEKLEKHYPAIMERIDRDEFDLANSSLDILQGQLVPGVRESWVRVDDNTLAIALGDVLTTVDPLLGQGANSASNQAMILGDEIVKNSVFDERFVEHVDNRRLNRVHSASRWTNFMMDSLATFPPEFAQFIGALSQSTHLADEFTDNFNYPDRQWDTFSSPQRIGAFVTKEA